MQVQNLIANTVLRRKTGNSKARITNMVVPTKVEHIYEDTIMWFMKVLFCFAMVVIYVPLVYRITYRIVSQNASRAKDTMRVMGMSMLPYWLSWFATYTIMNLTVVVLVTLLSAMNLMSP